MVFYMHINPPEKYCLYTLQTDKSDNPIYWALTRKFPDKASLVSFLADSVNTNDYDDSARWTCQYFNEINVTESDTYAWETLTWKTSPSGLRIPNVVTHRSLRPYHFETESGASVDVRNFKDEVFARVRARMVGLIPEKRYYYNSRWNRQGQPWHHCTHYRTNSHLYTRLRNTHTEEYEDENVYVKFKPKPKDIEAKYMWRDDFWRFGESGWKTHKHKHQWEHNIFRKK